MSDFLSFLVILVLAWLWFNPVSFGKYFGWNIGEIKDGYHEYLEEKELG